MPAMPAMPGATPHLARPPPREVRRHCQQQRESVPRDGCGEWLAVPRVRWPVSDLGNRSDEPPISPATLGRQRAPLGLGQMVGSSDLSLGPILTHHDEDADVRDGQRSHSAVRPHPTSASAEY